MIIKMEMNNQGYFLRLELLLVVTLAQLQGGLQAFIPCASLSPG